jgi:hypothetical protein
MVLLALPPADHLLIERDRGQFVPSRRRRMMANIRTDPGRTQPRAAYPQLKREWSPWPKFGWIAANLRDFSKG